MSKQPEIIEIFVPAIVLKAVRSFTYASTVPLNRMLHCCYVVYIHVARRVPRFGMGIAVRGVAQLVSPEIKRAIKTC